MSYAFTHEVLRPQPAPFVRWLRLALTVAVISAALCGAELLAIAEMLR